MPASAFSHKFLQESLASTQPYRHNALTDMTSIDRSLAGYARVKHKIKLVDRLMGNAALHRDGRAITLLSHIAEGDKLGSTDLQNRFLDDLAGGMGDRKVTVRREWFNHVQSYGWHFVGRLRGNGDLKLAGTEEWITLDQLKAGVVFFPRAKRQTRVGWPVNRRGCLPATQS